MLVIHFEKLNKSLILDSCTVGIIMRLMWKAIKFLQLISVCTVSVPFHKIFEEFQQWKIFSDGCSFLVMEGFTAYCEKNALQNLRSDWKMVSWSCVVVCTRDQHWTSGCRCDWCSEASIWYMGECSECCQSDGLHRSVRPDTSKWHCLHWVLHFWQSVTGDITTT